MSFYNGTKKISREQCGFFWKRELIILYVLKYLLNVITTCHISMEKFLNSGSFSILGYSVFKKKFPVSLWKAYQNYIMDYFKLYKYIYTHTHTHTKNIHIHIFLSLRFVYIFLRKGLTPSFRINDTADHCAWYEYVTVFTCVREVVLEQKKKPGTTDSERSF